MGKADQDNRANQLNPNNDAYFQSRGWDSRDDSFLDDGLGDRGRSWRNVDERFNNPPAGCDPATFLYNVSGAAEALEREVNFYLPWAMMTFGHEDSSLVVDFTYLHCFQEAAAFKVIRDWESASRQNFRRFTDIVVRFHGETVAGFIKCTQCRGEHRIECGFCALPPNKGAQAIGQNKGK